MITKYNNFVRMNEDFESTKGAKKLGGLFKGLFGSLMKGISDEFKKPLEDFSKNISKQKDSASMVKVVNDYLSKHRESLISTLNSVTTAPDVLGVVKDNLVSAYVCIDATVKNFSSDKFTFEELFSNSPTPTKKLFNMKEEKFNKNVEKFTHDMVLSFAKPYKIGEEDFMKPSEDAKDENEKQQIEDTQNGAQQSDEKNESMIFKRVEKMFEAVSEKDLKNLKDDIIKWFDGAIYKNTQKSLEIFKKGDEKKPTSLDIDNIINNMATDNKDSIKVMLNKMAELDKSKLIEIRDLLGLDSDNTPL